MTDETPPEADRLEDAPHPRETQTLYGHHAAEGAFLDAYTSGRLHHGWLITGPKGIGKATLAWRIARFLLAQPSDSGGGLFGPPEVPTTLDVAPDHPVAARIAALSEPALFLLRRAWDAKARPAKLKTVIGVDEVRALHGFFGLSRPDGGWRVVIVDSADEMNPQAANALLKMLEEPPKDTLILLISHQPSRLLPTIRSRCRTLRLNALGAQDLSAALAQAGARVEDGDMPALSALAEGSVGGAYRLLGRDGPRAYAHLISLFQGGRLDRPGALALTDRLSGRANAEAFDLVIDLLSTFLARLARAGVLGPGPEATPGEAQILAALSPHDYAARAWADLAPTLIQRLDHGRAVNLDPSSLVLDTLLRIEAAAKDQAAG